MNKKIKEFIEKINENSFLRYRRTTLIGGIFITVGIIGFIPSFIFGTPYIAKKFENARALEKKVAKKVSEDYRIAAASDIVKIDMESFNANNIFIDKSKKGYSYINIVDSMNMEVECEIAFDEKLQMSLVNIKSETLELVETNFNVGMSFDHALQVLANNMVGADVNMYEVELFLDKPVDLIIKNYRSDVFIKDSSVVKSLDSSTEYLNIEGDNKIESLNIKNPATDYLNIDSNIIGSFKNINVDFSQKTTEESFSQVNVSLNKPMQSLPDTININADIVCVNSSYNLANNEFNVIARKELNVQNIYENGEAVKTTINTKSVRELISYREDTIIDIDNEDNQINFQNPHSLENDTNKILVGTGKNVISINVLNDISKIVIQ